MRLRLGLVLGAIGPLNALGQVANSNFIQTTDSTIGVTYTVPSNWEMGEEAGMLVFQSPDAKARLSVNSTPLQSGVTLNSLFKEARSTVLSASYERFNSTEDWFVVTGWIEGSDVRYIKTILLPEHIVTLTLEFEGTLLPEFDSTVTTISRGFHATEAASTEETSDLPAISGRSDTLPEPISLGNATGNEMVSADSATPSAGGISLFATWVQHVSSLTVVLLTVIALLVAYIYHLRFGRESRSPTVHFPRIRKPAGVVYSATVEQYSPPSRATVQQSAPPSHVTSDASAKFVAKSVVLAGLAIVIALRILARSDGAAPNSLSDRSFAESENKVASVTPAWMGDFEDTFTEKITGSTATEVLHVGRGSFDYTLTFFDGSGHSCSGTFNPPPDGVTEFVVTLTSNCLNTEARFKTSYWAFGSITGRGLFRALPRY